MADNQAGVSAASPALDTDPERLSAMFDVNVVGPLRMTQAFAPALHKASGPLFRSKILNIGSGIISGGPWHTAYGSTKVSSRAQG
jgi:NAD(P)-dependent dehydrogenase (short-subunit alcohol dehydrogenase family)